MGGEATGSTAATTSVFIECALFDPVATALTGRRHDITSDARSRFERGIDPSLLPAALDAATAMVIELCGGEAERRGRGRRRAGLAARRHAALRPAGDAGRPGRARRTRPSRSLERLGFTVAAATTDRVTVAVPPWRNDVAGAGALDQAPRCARHGARRRTGRPRWSRRPTWWRRCCACAGWTRCRRCRCRRCRRCRSPTYTPRQVRAAVARRTLARRGMLECVTFSFTARDRAALFGDAPDGLRLTNPIAADLDQMRPTPLATLAPAAARNVARGLPAARCSRSGRPSTPTAQQVLAAGLRHGQPPRSWAGSRRRRMR